MKRMNLLKHNSDQLATEGICACIQDKVKKSQRGDGGGEVGKRAVGARHIKSGTC